MLQQCRKRGRRLYFDWRTERPAVVDLQTEVDAAIQQRTRAAGHWQGMAERGHVKMSKLLGENRFAHGYEASAGRVKAA